MKKSIGNTHNFLIIIVLSILLLLMSCTDSYEGEKENAEEMEEVFGNWEVIKLIEGSGLPEERGADELIGSIFQLEKNKFTFNNSELTIDSPHYIKRAIDTKNMPFETKESYYIQVSQFYPNTKFYKVDRMKMILFYKDSYYELQHLPRLKEEEIEEKALKHRVKFSGEHMDQWGYQMFDGDDRYKLIYGEWKITSVINENDSSSVYEVGGIINFSKDSVWLDGEKIGSDYPNYEFTIAPSNEDLTKKLNLEGNYYVQFFVPGNKLLGDFYIKDDNTLFMKYDRLYMQLERIDHIPNYRQYYQCHIEEREYDIRKARYENMNYKLFYGEWVVESLMAESEKIEAVDTKAMLGRTISFDTAMFRFKKDTKGEVTIENPYYAFEIIPQNEHSFIKGMPDQKEIGLTGEFYTFVMVDQLPEKTGFFIRDDNSLIMYYKNGYYKLKRMSHIPDYGFGI